MLQAAFTGGVDMIELRDRELDRTALERAAATFRRLADTYSALFIVNDDPALARASRADGVHVGQDDVAPGEVRELLGPDAIVGLSTHTEEQVKVAQTLPIDYISVGPIWETPTKEGRPATGLELISFAAASSTLPFFAIGGIAPGNAPRVIEAGARRLCVVRAIRDADDPAAAAAELRRAFGVAHEGVAPGG
jgi:thiamine-phosphate pyrophosphorylase